MITNYINAKHLCLKPIGIFNKTAIIGEIMHLRKLAFIFNLITAIISLSVIMTY